MDDAQKEVNRLKELILAAKQAVASATTTKERLALEVVLGVYHKRMLLLCQFPTALEQSELERLDTQQLLRLQRLRLEERE